MSAATCASFSVVAFVLSKSGSGPPVSHLSLAMATLILWSIFLTFTNPGHTVRLAIPSCAAPSAADGTSRAMEVRASVPSRRNRPLGRSAVPALA